MKSSFEEDLKQIRDSYDRAKNLLGNIESFSEKFEKFKDILDSEEGGIEANYQWIKDKKLEIDGFKEDSLVLLSKIKNNLSEVNEKISEMGDTYINFTELKGKINGRGNEIENLLSQSNGLKDDIIRIKSESQELLDEISSSYSDFQKKVEDMNTAYQRFLTIKEQIEHEDSGLEAIFNYVKNIKNSSSELIKEIRDYKDESNDVLKEIKTNKESSDTLKNQIESNLEIAEQKKEDIKEVTDLILDTGFANAFQSRAKKLFRGYVVWGSVFGVSVILFIIFLFILFYDKNINGIPGPDVVLYRLSLTTPLLLLIAFSIKQYGKERELNEKYEFKATIATVVRNHITFLIDIFGKDNEKILNFTNNTFHTLYKEPYNTDKSEDKIKEIEDELKKIKIKSYASDNLDMKEVVSSIKELKELIPDESTLTRIINIFVKK